MKTLFLRIFLAFWAATLLVVAATAGLAWYRFAQIQNVNVDIKELAAQASKHLNEGGVPAVQDWIVEAERKYPMRHIYIVDPSGSDLFKREMPLPYKGYIAKLRDAGILGEELPPSRKDDPLLLTPLFTDRDGMVYTIMVANPHWPINMLSETDVRAILALFALLTSGFVCWWLARYVSRPVVHLQSSARSLAAGNLEARVGQEFSKRRDELGVLARDFDIMADHIRNLLASKEDLLRGMSHELRSPLARLRVALGLARRPDADFAKQLDRIELEAERLDALIGQMLQLSQLRAVEPLTQREHVDLSSLVLEIVEDAKLEASAAQKEVALHMQGRMSTQGDHATLRSAIENVIRNAIRFTPVRSTVDVNVTRERGMAMITIDDCGPGVPATELERIFEPFYRVAESRDRDSGG
ncbi:MAG TPA: histidine kinase dimerization/phospho-acceptor domain-containing protein, partial [Steroidobacteraceae bacterium]|nr:histidine kinase dimerization/phospho-acceptor domain-containing protein [Steroidobacteraceae bacterium]